MYSTNNEEKSVIAERTIRILKNKIYKYMTSVLKDVYIHKLDKIVNKFNNIYHSNIFAKYYIPDWSEEVFVIKKVKNTVPWTHVLNNLNGEEVVGTSYEKELQKKVINYMLRGKGMIVHLIVGQLKKTQHK